MRQTTGIFTIAAAAGFFSSFADVSAQIATWQLEGTVAGVVNSAYQSTPNPYAGVVAVGDPWSSTLRVNLNSPPTPDSGLGNFADAIVTGSFRFSNGLSFDLWGSDFIHIESPHVILAYLASTEVNGHRPHIVNFNFYNWSSPAPTDLHEFASRFSLSAIGNPEVSIYADSGTLTSY